MQNTNTGKKSIAQPLSIVKSRKGVHILRNEQSLRASATIKSKLKKGTKNA